MTKFDSARFIDYLKSKWEGRACPLCGVGNWNVSESIFELREFNKEAFVIGGAPIVPVIPVTCANCGNTVLVNAIISGALESDKKEKGDANAK
jgi:hypothetical protein